MEKSAKKAPKFFKKLKQRPNSLKIEYVIFFGKTQNNMAPKNEQKA